MTVTMEACEGGEGGWGGGRDPALVQMPSKLQTKKTIKKNAWSAWWRGRCQQTPHIPQNVALHVAAHISFWVGGSHGLGTRQHGRRQSGGEEGGGFWFCLRKITHNNNILRGYGVPLTVQMEEPVKFLGIWNTSPAQIERKSSVCLRTIGRNGKNVFGYIPISNLNSF